MKIYILDFRLARKVYAIILTAFLLRNVNHHICASYKNRETSCESVGSEEPPMSTGRNGFDMLTHNRFFVGAIRYYRRSRKLPPGYA